MKKLHVAVFALILGVIGIIFVNANRTSQNNINNQPAQQQTQEQQQQQRATSDTKEVSFNINQFSLTEPSSLWFIANKRNALPLDYVPQDLIVPNVPLRLSPSEQQMSFRKIAQADLEALFDAAAKAGLQLEFGSGYRSSALQRTFYEGYVRTMGQAEADRSSARPGHSEHQTGLGVDFTRVDGTCHLEACFGTTAEGKWLKENAHTFGFILRYTETNGNETGYMYEPWHYRYVGKELAAEYTRVQATSLESFFGLPPAPDYL